MALRDTLMVRALGLRIPVLLFLGPRVARLDADGCEVVIPLRWRSKNHLGSMYVGALVAGADLAAGLPAARIFLRERLPVNLLFADLHAEFLKRADGDVHFTCREGRRIEEAVRATVATGERVTFPVVVTATVPSRSGEEPVARFTMGLTMKRRDPKPAR